MAAPTPVTEERWAALESNPEVLHSAPLLHLFCTSSAGAIEPVPPGGRAGPVGGGRRVRAGRGAAGLRAPGGRSLAQLMGFNIFYRSL